MTSSLPLIYVLSMTVKCKLDCVALNVQMIEFMITIN